MKTISQKQLSFICPVKFAEMPESANGRFCDQCNKEVFDLSDCTLEEAIELQRKHGSICGFVRTTAIVATTAATIGLVSCETTQSQNPESGKAGACTGSPNLPSGVLGSLPLVEDLERMKDGAN